MKLKYAAIIATVMMIVAGIALIAPVYLRQPVEAAPEPKPKVMLAFNLPADVNADEWCQGVAAILDKYQIGASLFLTGAQAEKYPQCLSYFSDKVDIGSATYSNVALTSISDYTLKLQTVQKGKAAVDSAGNLISRIFKAPFGAADADIYSLLSRSEIMVDFSYPDHYNILRGDQFLRFDAAIFGAKEKPGDIFAKMSTATNPHIIVFDNTSSVSDIKQFLSKLKMDKLEFVNASDLVGFTLTTRGVDHGNR